MKYYGNYGDAHPIMHGGVFVVHNEALDWYEIIKVEPMAEYELEYLHEGDKPEDNWGYAWTECEVRPDDLTEGERETLNSFADVERMADKFDREILYAIAYVDHYGGSTRLISIPPEGLAQLLVNKGVPEEELDVEPSKDNEEQWFFGQFS